MAKEKNNKEVEAEIEQNENNQPENNTKEEVKEEAQKELTPEEQMSLDLEKAKAEVAEAKDKYMRLYSDFENFRRRTAKEKIELTSTATEELMVALLPVLDDFERGLATFEKMELGDNGESMKEGIQLIFNKFNKTLEQRGLKPMVSKGEVFDMDLHEGITKIPAPTEELKGKVIDDVEKGYFLKDKVIRYAKVVIGE